MKVTFIVLFAVVGASAKNVFPIEGPDPPIEDPLLRPGQTPFNVTLDPLVMLTEGSFIENLIAEGLSSFKYLFTWPSMLLSFDFEFTIREAFANATYSIDGYIDARPFRQESIPSGNLTGSDLAKIAVKNLKITGTMSIFLNTQGKVQLSRLSLKEFSFDSLSLDFGTNFQIGGEPIDWPAYNENLKENFDADFAQHNLTFSDKARQAANNYLKNYTLEEFICLIRGDCE